jgi:hypothetical protein
VDIGGLEFPILPFPWEWKTFLAVQMKCPLFESHHIESQEFECIRIQSIDRW